MTRPSTQVLDKLESLATDYIQRLDGQNQLIEQLSSELEQARNQIAELEEANAFLEAKHKEIVERMEAGLEEWARRESARRRLTLHGDSTHSPLTRSRPGT